MQRPSVRRVFIGIVLMFSAMCLSANDHDRQSKPTDGIRDTASSALMAVDSAMTQRLLGLLFKNAALPINQHPSCLSAFLNPDTTTLGEYMAELLSHFSEPGDNRIHSRCQLDDHRRHPVRCEVIFQHNEPAVEVFFSYGLRFDLNEYGEIRSDSVRCPGMP